MNFLDYIINIIESLGYFGVFFSVFLEYACLPLPSEILLPFIGVLSSYGIFNLIIAIAVSVFAGILGSTICYYIGYFGGAPILNWLSTKSSGAKKSLIKLNIFLNKYDKYAVLIARMFPLTRTYVSLGVGALKMKYRTFISYSFAGIVVWNSILISLGYFLGENTPLIESILSKYSFLAIGLLIILICILAYIFMRNSKNKNIINK
ncbi:MAG: DedA family protein [Bacilli bacterium]